MSPSSSTTLEGPVAVVGAATHPHAYRRLKESWPGIVWVEARRAEDLSDTMPAITLITHTDMPEGAFNLSFDLSYAPRILVRGGPFSGVIYGIEELIQRQSRAGSHGIELAGGTVEKIPRLAYRTFWTWDHSSNWELNQIGHQEIGVFNPYGKPPSGFLKDYKRMVDFCSANQIAAIVTYGFFRDSHGGVSSAQELCTYANERGVRILPGIAIGAYGGVYWEGNNKYNLATWLKENPGFAADMERGVGFQLQDLAFPLTFPQSDYTRTACPSEPANIAWMKDAISWLVDTVDVGGINIESGDYGVCGCERCILRREGRESANRRDNDAESWSHSDMADNYPQLFEAARSKRDDLWLYCELQWDNLLDADALAPLSALPDGGIYQHTVNKSYWNRARTELQPSHIAALPTATNVLRCQFACQWNGDERTERYSFNAPVFADMSKKAAEIGMQGLTIWGEPSPYHASAELSYLAFGRFGYEPDLSWNDFVSLDVAPRVGGAAAATQFIGMMQELDASPHIELSRLKTIRGEAIAGSQNQSDESMRRWLWLADRANQRVYMGY